GLEAGAGASAALWEADAGAADRRTVARRRLRRTGRRGRARGRRRGAARGHGRRRGRQDRVPGLAGDEAVHPGDARSTVGTEDMGAVRIEEVRVTDVPVPVQTDEEVVLHAG